MDFSSLEELVFDPLKCSKLSMDKKREVIYELTKWSDCAADILQAWSRQDLLQILCLELGKERKYTGLTKSKIIDHLLKVLSKKKSRLSVDDDERMPKRQRKSDTTNSAAVAVVVDDAVGVDNDKVSTTYCKNSACKAKLSQENVFCKRCSCCICKQFDDNKDPTLWLLCESCGMSCHLECALRDEKSGISGNRQEDKGLDGRFCCVYCEKVNDLLSSLRKQLVVAKDTRRVDILCYRLSLSQKILAGTKIYVNVYGIIDEAVKKVEEDVGPLTGLPVKTARGIVNRLSSGPEVQRLCFCAMANLDSMIPDEVSDMSDSTMVAAKTVRFEDSNRVTESNRAHFCNSQSEVPNTNSRIVEVEQSQSQSPATNCSTVSNPSSVDDETNNVMPCSNANDKFSLADLNDAINSSEIQKETATDVVLDKEQKENDTNINLKNDTQECIPYIEGLENGLPITPCKLENAKDLNGKNNNNNRLKRVGKYIDNPSVREKESSKRDIDCNGIGDKNFEYCVKVIRRLECDGHIETTFRQKFLTWYSMTATPQEVRVVKVFIGTFIEDPASLAGQLVDTFSDIISNKRCSTVPAGFCLKLWH